MLSPELVVPFLQHADPIVRDHAHRYFRRAVDFGPLTADTYWAIIDRLGETDAALGFAADLRRLPQTDESLHRLIGALASPASANFAAHYQYAAEDMQMDVLLRNRAELLACPQLLPHVRQHLELRLQLLDESPEIAWDRLMEHGRELGGADAFAFNASLGDALVEAAARGGASVCDKAMVMMDDESAEEDWREIFAVRVLGETRYEPAIDALVEKFAFDTDVVREDVNTALALIGTPRVIDRIVEFYPGKPWHVRLYAHASLVRIKRPESEAALLKLLGMELALENVGSDEEEDSLLDSILIDLAELCSLSALDESRRFIAESPDDPEADDLCEDIVATAIMSGVALPEEADYRKRIKRMHDRLAAGRLDVEQFLRGARENWMKTGVSFPPADEDLDEDNWHSSRQPASLVSDYQRPARIEPIRNTEPKIGRNDPCPCGSGKKYKKCCGKS